MWDKKKRAGEEGQALERARDPTRYIVEARLRLRTDWEGGRRAQA